MNKFKPQLSLSDKEFLSLFSKYEFYISQYNKVIFYFQFPVEKEKELLKNSNDFSILEDYIDDIFNKYNFMPCNYDYIKSNVDDFDNEVNFRVNYDRLHRVYSYSCINCSGNGAGRDFRFHIDETIKHYIDEYCPLCEKKGLYILP